MTSDDLLGTVKAALDSFKRCRCWLPHCGACRAFVEMDKTNTIISLVARCEQAEADLAALRQRHAELEAQLAKAPGIDLEDCTILVRDGDTLWVNGTVFTLHGYRIEPKERHAEEVEAAFREAWAWLGQEPYCETADDEWLASEAKARLT